MTSQINKILSFNDILSYKDQETRLGDTQQHSAIDSTKNKGHWGEFLEKAHHFDIELGNTQGRTEDRQVTNTNRNQGNYFKPLASLSFPGSFVALLFQEAFLYTYCWLLELLFGGR